MYWPIARICLTHILLLTRHICRYWIWLQESSIFTQSSRAAVLEIMNQMTFLCKTLTEPYGQCIDPGTFATYNCDSYSDSGYNCAVQGREIIFVTQGISTSFSYWTSFGYLVLIYVCFKLLILLLLYYPWDRITYLLRSTLTNTSDKTALAATLSDARIAAKALRTVQSAAKLAVVDSEEKVDGDLKIEVSSEDPTAALSWTHLSVVLPKTQQVLIDDSSGIVKSGRILALMGPSGAGKTTLLNVRFHFLFILINNITDSTLFVYSLKHISLYYIVI